MLVPTHDKSHGTNLVDSEQSCLVVIDPLCGRSRNAQPNLLNGGRPVGLALLDAATARPLPIFLSVHETVADETAWPDVLATLPSDAVFRRRTTNPWDDETLQAAVNASGRKSIVFAGPFSEPALVQAALSALVNGYDTIAVTDLEHETVDKYFMTMLLRLTQAGVVPVTAAQLLSEWQ